MRAVRTDDPVSRFGFTTSRAVGNAVVRNKVRRRLREAVGSLSIAQGWNIVFNSRVKIATASYAQIRMQMKDLLERAELLEEPLVEPAS
jgi:ribonuclease P protein component